MIKHVGSSDISVQYFLISSRLNDLANCYRRFNFDIIKLYISALDDARKLKIQILCQSAIYKQNVTISLCLNDSVQCGKGLYFLAQVLHLCSFGAC